MHKYMLHTLNMYFSPMLRSSLFQKKKSQNFLQRSKATISRWKTLKFFPPILFFSSAMFEEIYSSDCVWC